MDIYVIRHGETDNNVENKINGHNDIKLNDNGIKQAALARDELKKIKIDLIICSPLQRTIETANIININNIPMIMDKSIIERDAGKLTNKSLEFINEDDWWNINPIGDYQDAEKPKSVYDRVSNFLEQLKQKYPNKTVLLVTHGGVCKVIKAYFERMPQDGNLDRFYQDNCEIVRYHM